MKTSFPLAAFGTRNVIFSFAAIVCAVAINAEAADDRVKIDNDQVRVLRARYGPREKGVMHEHSWSYVVAFLTDCNLQVTSPEGVSKTAARSPGDVSFGGPSKHVEENLNDKPLEVVVVEFKN